MHKVKNVMYRYFPEKRLWNGITDVIEMLRILSEWTLDIDDEVSLYMLHRLAEGCKVDQVYVSPKGHLYQLVQ